MVPKKLSGEEYINVHRIAHELGIRTNCTMLYGHVETYEDRINHLGMLRDLQAAQKHRLGRGE